MAELKPRMPIRRFDVFAEYNRLKNDAAGLSQDRAKGNAIWLAKVVAGRRFGAASLATAPERERHEKAGAAEAEGDGFKSAGGVLQTDQVFDEEIIARMGSPFYQQVFQPAIEAAYREGKRYEEIRDTIRKGWK
jgi:hypothetical protein